MPKIDNRLKFFSIFLCVVFDTPPSISRTGQSSITFPKYMNVTAQKKNGTDDEITTYDYNTATFVNENKKFTAQTGLKNCQSYLVAAVNLKQAKRKLSNQVKKGKFEVKSNNSTKIYTYKPENYHIYFKVENEASNTAILTANELNELPVPEASTDTNNITIVTQPSNITIIKGGYGTINVSAQAGGATLYYQWQVLTNDTWTNVNDSTYYLNENTSSLTVYPGFTDTLQGTKYRCVITNEIGTKTVNSDTAILSLKASTINITTQPTSISTGENTSIFFEINADGSELNYHWQCLTKDASNFVNISNNYQYSGVLTNKLTINNIYRNFDTYKYRCFIQDIYQNSIVSNEALLTVLYIYIDSQPEGVSTAPNTEVTFSVEVKANHGDLKDLHVAYQWFYYNPTTKNITNIKNATNKILVLPAETVKTNLNGYQYGCTITSDVGTLTSSYASLEVTTAPEIPSVKITKQPIDISITSDDIAIFTIEAKNANEYQWEANYGDGWITLLNRVYTGGTCTGVDTKKLYINIQNGTTEWDGSKYRCIVSNTDIESIEISEEVTLTIIDVNNTENPEGE